MKFGLKTMLVFVSALAVTLAIGIANRRHERVDGLLLDRQVRPIRQYHYPRILSLFIGNRLGNPIHELDLFAIGLPPNEMRPGFYSARLNGQLLQQIKNLDEVHTVWIDPDVRNYSGETKQIVAHSLPNVQLKHLPSPDKKKTVYYLPAYQWFNWVATFLLSFGIITSISRLAPTATISKKTG